VVIIDCDFVKDRLVKVVFLWVTADTFEIV